MMTLRLASSHVVIATLPDASGGALLLYPCGPVDSGDVGTRSPDRVGEENAARVDEHHIHKS